MDDLITREEVFLNEWASQCEGFVRDGIVNINEYSKSKRKILFLLKEVNGGKDWDLRDFLHQGGRQYTWNNVVRWVKGIENLEKNYIWSEIAEVNDEERKAILQHICAVNLKKTSGTHTADAKKISLSTKENAVRLKQQIDMYSPDLIICCGTGWDYYRYVLQEKRGWEKTSRGIQYLRENNGRIVIDYHHPEVRVMPCIAYYGLIDAIKEILFSDLSE